ncbi:hypothetical protein [Nocardia vaccinii]|nr:hypothetical protein [Nocardia vaccinii]
MTEQLSIDEPQQLDVHQHPIKPMILVCKGSARLLGNREQELWV